MELEILGNSGGSPGSDAACSGYLVREGDSRLLLDCGPGIVPSLQRNNRCGDLTAVFISHMHADHSLDLWTLAWRLTTYSWAVEITSEEDRRPIPLFLPPGGVDLLRKQAEVLIPNRFFQAFDVHECSPRDRFQVGPFTLACMPMEHGVITQGVRVAAGSSVLAYTGDTRLFADLPALADGVDLFLCEATGRRPDEPGIVNAMHLTGEQAGYVADEAKARSLLLTHFRFPDAQWRQSLVTDAMNRFGGQVEAALHAKIYEVSHEA